MHMKRYMTDEERAQFVEEYGKNVPGAQYNIGDHVRYYDGDACRTPVLTGGVVEAIKQQGWWFFRVYTYLLEGNYYLMAESDFSLWEN